MTDKMLLPDVEPKSGARELRTVVNKSNTMLLHVASVDCYKEAIDPETGKTQVWMDGDTDWGYAPLGTNNKEFNAVIEAVHRTLKDGDQKGSRNTLSNIVLSAAQRVSQVTFPHYDFSQLAAKGLPDVVHGENVMFLPSGALAVEAAMRAAQEYFDMKTRVPAVSRQLKENARNYLDEHPLADDMEIEAYFKKAAHDVVALLPKPMRQARLTGLVTRLLVDGRANTLGQVLGTDGPLPTLDEILRHAPPQGDTPAEVFTALTGRTLSTEASKRLEACLEATLDGRIAHSVYLQVREADHAADGLRPSNAQILDNILEQVWQPVGSLICYTPSYHGATAGTTGITEQPRQFNERTFSSERVLHVRTPHPYHQQEKGESESDYVQRLLDEVEYKILFAGGKGCVAGIIIEPVSGSSLGGVPVPKGYLEGLRKLSIEYGPKDGRIPLIYDEVMSGIGRTGKFAAFQHPDIAGETLTDPDILLYSKALHSGAEQAAAVVFHPEFIAEMSRAHRGLPYSSTTMNFPPCAAAVEETIRQIQKKMDSGELERQAQKLTSAIKSSLEQSDILKDHFQMRGFGHMLGIELVNDHEEREQIKPGFKLAHRIYEIALHGEGLGTLPVAASRNAEKEDGAPGSIINSDTVFLLPTYVMKDIDIERMAKRLVRAMEKGVAEIKNIELPKPPALPPLGNKQLGLVQEAVGRIKCSTDTLLGVTPVEGNTAIEVSIKPTDTVDNPNALKTFRETLMPVSGGYSSWQEGDHQVFRLDLEQTQELLKHYKTVPLREAALPR